LPLQCHCSGSEGAVTSGQCSRFKYPRSYPRCVFTEFLEGNRLILKESWTMPLLPILVFKRGSVVNHAMPITQLYPSILEGSQDCGPCVDSQVQAKLANGEAFESITPELSEIANQSSSDGAHGQTSRRGWCTLSN
jgi:hypothetical protein